MRVTVSICTRQRASNLANALESLVAIDGSRSEADLEWDVLVVDNGATGLNPDPEPDTAKVIRRFEDVLPLRAVLEPNLGLSHARNTALREATGDYLIFIDDDATVPADWLGAYVAGFARHPEAVFFGGPIRAMVAGVDPSLLEAIRAEAPGALSWLEPELAESVIEAGSNVLPWGCNMALRMDVARRFRFDCELGRRPNRPADSGEDTAFCQSMLSAGHRGVWLPGTGLLHHVSPDRCGADYIRAFYRGIGWRKACQKFRAAPQNLALLRRKAAWVLFKERMKGWVSQLAAPSRAAQLRRLRKRAWAEGYASALEAAGEARAMEAQQDHA